MKNKPISPPDGDQHIGSLWNIIKNILPIISALTGILFAASVYFGRLFYYRWFDLLGIPLNLLDPTLEDYVIVGWGFSALWLCFVLLLLVPVGIALFFSRVMWRRLQESDTWIILEKHVDRTVGMSPPRFRQLANIFLVGPIIGAVLILLVVISVSWPEHLVESGFMGPKGIGSFSGFEEVEIISDNPILPESLCSRSSLDPAQDKIIYLYTGLYLASYENGFYFLFNKIDSSMCRPSAIYVVPDNKIVSISILSRSRDIIPNSCLSQ